MPRTHAMSLCAERPAARAHGGRDIKSPSHNEDPNALHSLLIIIIMHIHTLTLLASAISTATAHYTFSQLVVNDEMVGSDWTYIREHTRGYLPTKGSEILENDFRCQPGGSTGANTDVYSVKSGDKIALKQAFGGTGMEHPGPAQVYLSKAPSGDVKTYDGSGDWFKVSEQLLCSSPGNEAILDDAWCTYGEDRIEFTMPSTVPSGQYLVRAEHIPLHGAHVGEAEFYYACAQVEVEGGSNGSVPSPSVKIPGVYAVDDASINFSIWGADITEYPEIPGPEVVAGGQMRGSKDGSSKSIAKVAKRALVSARGLAARAGAVVRR
ncbi:hypothetical protein AC579_5636 [Pseudocercospora musae]|uniref:AA9 family lytic polysaccharide monooxygenase n=1 Tax=Pseudocercospora musae TaxID=113226 RepID=A0A139IEZ5_9PEZI|nr:hypothetical protein AC579_5636 [Pseudocercospora musae]